nr:glycoside hydrolase family 3 C-terminal domain-containing protein [Clostridia bacterium]
PTKIDCAFDSIISEGVSAVYCAGYSGGTTDIALLTEAVDCAKTADVVLVFAGLTDEYESEGFDRSHINLPDSHNDLIKAVANVNKNVVVVLAGGSAVTMPWLGQVKGVLHSILAGQAGGSAVVDLLYGAANPCGKLAETYPLALRDNPSYRNFPGSQKTVEYRESIFVGYRYYDTAGKDVLFPFGFGLSYTEFKYSNLRLNKKSIGENDRLTVSFKVKNVGAVAGAEISQLYVRDCESTAYRPEKELKGFAKTYLEPGEEKTVKLELDRRAFAFFNTAVNDWTVESGEFDILVGASSRDIRLKNTVTVTAEPVEIPDLREAAPFYYEANVRDVPDSQFEAVLGREIPPSVIEPGEKLDLTNCLGDASITGAGSKINSLLDKVVTKFALGSTNGPMIRSMMFEIPIKDFISMSMGVFTEEMAQGLLMILNDESKVTGIGKIVGDLANAVKNIGALMESI